VTDDLLRDLRHLQRALENMTLQAQQLAAGEGSDDAGTVRVTCAPGGRVLDIESTAQCRRLQTYELREAVLQAAGRASEAAQEALSTAMSGLLGGAELLGGDVPQRAQKHVDQYRTIVEEPRSKLEQLRSTLGR
jgi:nitrogen-specific signal transduction histidine kinase